jgi:hypothetical protein
MDTSSPPIHIHGVHRDEFAFKYSQWLPSSDFGGLEVVCWPSEPKFAGSNPAEAVRFFRVKKSSARLPSEGK